MGTDSNMMDLDNSGAIYAYNCPTGTCQGFAYQVWEAMPAPQKEAYLSAVMDGILAWHPDATPTITVREWLVAHAGAKPDLVPTTLAKVDAGQKWFSAGLFFPAGMTVGPRTPHWAAHLP